MSGPVGQAIALPFPVGAINKELYWRSSGSTLAWRDRAYIDARGYLAADGSTDDTSNWATLIVAAQNTVAVGVQGCDILLPQAETVISDTLDFTRMAGCLRGTGRGISPAYSADPGTATVIRWNGSAGSPMIRVRDARHFGIENLRLEGKDTAKPSYAIEFNNNGGTNGSNEYLWVRDVYIGRYTWSSQGTNKGLVTSGIGFTGTNGNNDQFRLDSVEVYYPDEYGLYVPNSQSVGGTARNLSVVGAGVTGVYAGASIRLDDPEFYSCAQDIEVAAGCVTFIVDNIKSEFSGKLATVAPSTGLIIRGGNVQCGSVISGGHVLIDAYPSGAQLVKLQDINFTGMTNAANCTIDFGPDNGGNVGNFRIMVENAGGLEPAQLNLLGTFWASSPISKGTIEWDSRVSDKRYHFRNELRKNGREAVNPLVWDAPLNSTSTSADTFAPTQIVMGYTAISATHTAKVSDQTIVEVGSAGAITVNLPTATAYQGKTYTIKRTSASNNVTVDPNSTETIDGAATKVLASQYAAVTIMSDGANWQIVSSQGTVT